MKQILAEALGRFEGEGVWRDEAGDSHRYRVEIALADLSGGGLRCSFRHTFFEEDTPDVVQSLDFVAGSESILSFRMQGLPCVGRGYFGRHLLHYTIPIPGKSVEVTHFFTSDGVVVAGHRNGIRAGDTSCGRSTC
jgi:hypothetical protein